MKRIFAVVLCLALLCGVGAIPAAAEQLPGQVAVSRTVEQLSDGYYVVETVYQSVVQPRSNTTSGSKTAEYYYGSSHVFSVTVTGSFTYDGSTAKATSASGAYTAYVPDVTRTGGNAYTSGASAIASVSVSYQGAPLSRTVRLTCDPNGNLS